MTARLGIILEHSATEEITKASKLVPRMLSMVINLPSHLRVWAKNSPDAGWSGRSCRMSSRFPFSIGSLVDAGIANWMAGAAARLFCGAMISVRLAVFLDLRAC